MKFGGMVDSERLDYDQVLGMSMAYEGAGFEYLGMFDHFVPIYSEDRASVLECWTTLGALARDTAKLNIGPLVTCSSYRSPVVVAKMSSTIANLSGGRHFLGIGLGWYDREFEALEIEMTPFKERIDQTAEFVEVVKKLLEGESVTHEGKNYRFKGLSAAEPSRPHPVPLLMGSEKGGPKMMRLMARLADNANIGWNMDLGELETKLGEFDALCEEEGRDPSKVLKSTNFDLLVGADDGEYRSMVESTEKKFRPRFGGMEAYKDKIGKGVVGLPEECMEKVDRVKSLGVGLIFFQPLDSPDRRSVEVFSDSLR